MSAQATDRQITRPEQARLIARRVAEHVHRVAPPGLGHWPEAWEIVAEASEAFLDALHTWEATGTDEAKDRGQRATLAVLRAWKRAAAEWERAGRPELDRARSGPATVGAKSAESRAVFAGAEPNER